MHSMWTAAQKKAATLPALGRPGCTQRLHREGGTGIGTVMVVDVRADLLCNVSAGSGGFWKQNLTQRISGGFTLLWQ